MAWENEAWLEVVGHWIYEIDGCVLFLASYTGFILFLPFLTVMVLLPHALSTKMLCPLLNLESILPTFIN